MIAGAARGSLVASLLLVATAAAGTEPAPWFREEAAARGLDFEHRSGHGGRYLFPEIHAGGAALFDADGDGDLDAFLVDGGSLDRPAIAGGNRLFLNRGDGTFEDKTAQSGAAGRGYGMGVAAGDYDGDGRVDLYVTNVGPNQLLRNLGGGRFDDSTERAGVGLDGWGSSSAFLDYDADGDLDLFTLRYLHWTVEGEPDCFDRAGRLDYCGPLTYDAPAPDVLYRNRGDGTFEDLTRAAGLEVAFGTGLGVATGDFDGNGWPDLFVANDGMLDQLWLNRGDGTFRDEAVVRGVAMDLTGQPKAGMGVAPADLDADCDLDLLVTNLAGETDSLFVNRGDYFADRTGASGLAARSRALTRFGVAWADFDNDGIDDLYIAAGAIARRGRALDPADPYAEPNLLLRGLFGLRLEEVEPRGGTRPELVATSRAVAVGDVDGDGGLDLLVVNRDAPAHLLINRVPGRGNYLRVRAVDGDGRDVPGAVVSARIGEGRRCREIRTASSYQAASEPVAHFGLGSATRADDLEVRWPGGELECFGAREGGRTVELVRGSGAACKAEGGDRPAASTVEE